MRYDREATAGAARLDEREPGWWRRVDVDALDMGDCYNCVLGQVFGSYPAGISAVGLSGPEWALADRARDLGYTVPKYSDDWDSLDHAWAAQVARRRRFAGGAA